MKFAELAAINSETDKLEFILVPVETENGYKFTIEAELKRG